MKNTFEILFWDEKPYLELSDKIKYTKVSVEKKYTGYLVGKGQLEYVMAYHADGSASFVGIEHFEGRVDGSSGSVTFEHKGVFNDGVAKSTFNILVGSGTDQLIGFLGEGYYETGHSMTVDFELTIKTS